MSNWCLTFYAWISSHCTLEDQSLQNLNQHLTLLQTLHNKKYDFTTNFYNLIQRQIDEITKSNQDDENFFKYNCQSVNRIVKFKDIQLIELLKFVLIEIKDQVEFG
jgi:hypothetical protein